MRAAPNLLQLIPDIFFDALGLEISKRYARTIMSRNNALVSLILMVISLISSQWVGVTASGILFLLFLHEAYGEQVFFSRYLQEMRRELRERSQAVSAPEGVPDAGLTPDPEPWG